MGSHNNSIRSRNILAAKESETLLWRAFCDSIEDAREYIAADAVLVNPLLHPRGRKGFEGSGALHAESEPTLAEALDEAEPWASYSIRDQEIVEVDMMAVAVMYKLSLTDRGGKTTQASVSSTWRQVAGGDWLLCGMMLVPQK